MKMTQAIWSAMTPAARAAAVDLSGLSPQLLSHEGCRVEAVTEYDETRRFIVGRSTGWRPCSLEIKRRDSSGGLAAEMKYKTVRRLYRVRESRG